MVGIANFLRRTRARSLPKLSGEVIGNEWKSNIAGEEGAYYPEVRVKHEGLESHFVDEVGQIPAREVGQAVVVVRDPKSGDFRILESWGWTGFILAASIGFGVAILWFSFAR